MIREATLDDIPRLVELGDQFFTSGDYWGERRKLAPLQFAEHLIKLTRSSGVGFFVIDRGGEVTGAVAVAILPDIFTGEKLAMKLHWISDPAKPSAGLKLEKRAREWAKAQGVSTLKMSAVNDSAAELLQRLGYVQAEVTYSKVI